ncbi:MAG: 3-isopropylmalate dehydratase small subunit [bacterium]
MKGISIHRGKVCFIDRSDIDTDQIMPKQFLKRVERTGFGEFVFYEWRYLKDGTINPDFELNKYPGASILVTGPNFGCGSSREHAVWGLKEFGFKVIISPSFADIFYSNAIENLLLPCTVKHEYVTKIIENTKQKQEYWLTVDLPNQAIFDDYGLRFDFWIDPQAKERFIKGWDSIDLVLRFEDSIKEYERNRPLFFPVLNENVDL